MTPVAIAAPPLGRSVKIVASAVLGPYVAGARPVETPLATPVSSCVMYLDSRFD